MKCGNIIEKATLRHEIRASEESAALLCTLSSSTCTPGGIFLQGKHFKLSDFTKVYNETTGLPFCTKLHVYNCFNKMKGETLTSQLCMFVFI